MWVHFRIHVSVIEHLDALDLSGTVGVMSVIKIDRDCVKAGRDAACAPLGTSAAVMADQIWPAL